MSLSAVEERKDGMSMSLLLHGIVKSDPCDKENSCVFLVDLSNNFV